MVTIRDKRLHEQLMQAELEDLQLLQKEVSRYLEFWQAAAEREAAAANAALRPA